MGNDKVVEVEEAVSYFEQGYNCAQNVFLVMQKTWNIGKPFEPKVVARAQDKLSISSSSYEKEFSLFSNG